MGKVTTGWGGRRGTRLQPTALFTLLAGAISGCSNTTINEPRARITPAYVTREAAAALQPDGRFALPAAVVSPPGQLSEAHAKTLAARYVKDAGQQLKGYWSKYHGRAVDPAALSVCDRAVYAANPYVSVTGELSQYTERLTGAHWVIPMCGADRTLQVVVSLSALATEFAANSADREYYRLNAIAFGVPRSADATLFSPEGAAAYAFRKTGKRVSSVPELVMNPFPEVPGLVRWRMDVESAVAVKGAVSGTSRQLSTLLVGFGEVVTSSGLLDSNPQAAAPMLSWRDPNTKGPVTAVLSTRAPAGVELVTREQP